MAADPCGRVNEVRAELDWLLSVEDEACRLTDMHDAGELPLRVTHNDTKINNVLFDEESLKPLVVVDLDTVMPGLVGHDFGDAIRFAANFVEEDSPEADKAGLNLKHLLGVRGGVPEGDRARADGGGSGDAGQQLLLRWRASWRPLPGRLHHGGQVLQDPFSAAQSGAHPLPDRAGEGYAEEDERHERHRAGLLDEVQGKVTAMRCWQGVCKDILHAL